MNIIRYPQRETWDELLQRPEMDNSTLTDTVAGVLCEVKAEGDAAERKFGLAFVNVEVENLMVTPEETEEADKIIESQLLNALELDA